MAINNDMYVHYNFDSQVLEIYPYFDEPDFALCIPINAIANHGFLLGDHEFREYEFETSEGTPCVVQLPLSDAVKHVESALISLAEKSRWYRGYDFVQRENRKRPKSSMR